MIIRIAKDKNNPYVIINKKFLQDPRLSWKAKGILAYLLSLPDDWKIFEEELAKHAYDGIKALKTGIKELVYWGYIERKKSRNDQGKYTGWEYCVRETSPTIPFSDVGFSDVRKRPATNNDVTDNNSSNDNNDNGVFSTRENTQINEDVVEAIKLYMNDLYKQRTNKKHPYLKTVQYKQIYETINSFANENNLDYDGIVEIMVGFLNSKSMKTDWNINHFATEGIMLNRLYESGLV